MVRRQLVGSIALLLIFAGAANLQAGIFDCDQVASRLNASTIPCVLLVCPQGDTPSFADQGWTIDIWTHDINGTPISSIPAEDYWLIDCDPGLDVTLCGGPSSSNADAPGDLNGKATMSSTTLVGGGCADGMVVVVQGFVQLDSLSGCTVPKCYPIYVRSPDLDGNLIVDLVDLSTFSQSYPPHPYSKCCDFDIDNDVDLADLATFAIHFEPRHQCY